MIKIPADKYVIDTCSIIDGYSDLNIRSTLQRLIKVGRLKSPPTVMWELEVGADSAFTWAKQWESMLIQELSYSALSLLDGLISKYGKPFKDPEYSGKIYSGLIKKGSSYEADPEIVALAIDNGWTVVTEQDAIKGACKCEKIECISLVGLAKKEAQEIQRGFDFR